jgi:hypothetical protein
MNAAANSFEEGTVTSLCAASLILACSITDATFADAKHSLQQPKAVLTLVVRDLVGIDLPTRNIARAQVVRILRSAGVELRWVDAAGSDDPNVTSPTYLTVVIAAQSPTSRTTWDVMGFALRTGSRPRAYVFYDLVRSFVRKFKPSDPRESSVGVILGHAIAHELGHLLIPGEAHGAGIMRGNWSFREWSEAVEGALLFHPDDVKAIQEQLRSR